MPLRKRLVIVIAALAAAGTPVAGVTAAHAQLAVVRDECAAVTTWTFSPPLTLSNQSGTISATYSANCADESLYGSPLPIGGIPNAGVSAGPGVYQYTYPYFGNCANAVFGYGSGGSGTIMDGSLVIASYSSGGWSEMEVDVLDAACGKAATGVAFMYGSGS